MKFPVTEDDARPAGRPDRCFYCKQSIGTDHLDTCVLLIVDTTYNVFVNDVHVGEWRTQDPAWWDEDHRRFHKNESGWCKGNMMDGDDLKISKSAQAELAAYEQKTKGCVCPIVRLEPSGRSDRVRKSE